MNQKKSIENQLFTDRPLVWTALITPLFANDEIDYVSLRNLVLQQNAAHNGILLLGSTGEGLALTAQEHLSIVKYVCAMTLQVPLMVAVGGYNLNEQLAWIEECNQLPINAYLLASPIYAKPGPVGQTLWFKSLLDAANFPCMLYNVPSRSSVEITITALQQVQNHKNCWALKEASGDLHKLLAYKEHCPSIDLYSGEDAMMPYLAGAGVKGLVSVSSNVWPEASRQYVAMALAHQNVSLFPLWHKAITALFQVANPIPVKVLMAELNMISSAKLRLPLCQEEISAQHGLLDTHRQIQQWLENNSNNPLAQHYASTSTLSAENFHSVTTTNLRDINS
ncbi:4-hydroxy-tetrahydrodipicolinate synthase [Cognaticolwellia beringensis]|uniref:4-hydroxy-tetrahydrodipicolinate synthase n=1 Tax=Cognaticolwellia beringensis TaxID=1967665 RepID=A0A222G6E9_9GAMM|nr:4-hydroxy-tetrahydrodipicolinate synthase [Cognaticolwellia beringensis]ASP47465.1 4-hydroxy-tetrahydrodipicolinate synthase [Cognaticolwellia beringensis]